MELPYREGSWFAVPLRQGGFGLGLVARATEEGKVIVCYFFGPRRETVPVLADARHAKASDAVRVARVGDLFLLRGQWPIIGRHSFGATRSLARLGGSITWTTIRV